MNETTTATLYRYADDRHWYAGTYTIDPDADVELYMNDGYDPYEWELERYDHRYDRDGENLMPRHEVERLLSSGFREVDFYDMTDVHDLVIWLDDSDEFEEIAAVVLSLAKAAREDADEDDEDPDYADYRDNLDKLISRARSIVELVSIMTTSEAETEFELASGTAQKAAIGGYIPARKAGGTWLIRRVDAVARWGKRLSKSTSLTLLALSLAVVITRMM